MTLESARRYLNRMELNRKRDEPHNKRAYADARQLAALVSIAEFGTEPYAKQALKSIKSI